MADIDIQCPDCKTITSISEFAEVTFVKCKACGRRIERPHQKAEAAPEKKLRLRQKQEPAPGDPAPPPDYLSTIKPPKRQKRVSSWRISHHIVAWMMFLVLGAVMWFLRYGGYLSKSQVGTLTQFAPLVVLAFHILILLKAFQDSIFQGILCLLVPGYSLVYMFFINDDFYARSILAGLLVGTAEDSYFYYRGMVIGIYEAVTAWLASGG